MAAMIRRYINVVGAGLIALSVAHGGVVYTFSGVTGSRPEPGQTVACRFTSPGFIAATTYFSLERLTSCTNCGPGVMFTPIQNSEDTVGIGKGALYYFDLPLGAFRTVGAHKTIPGRVNVGTLTVEVTPGLTIANTAMMGASSVTSEEIISLFSDVNVTNETANAVGVPLPTELAGVGVTVKDGLGVERAARLLMVSPYQVNIVTPAGLAAGSGSLAVRGPTGVEQSLPVTVVGVAPAFFTMNADGRGVPAAQIVRVRADGSQVFEDPFTWNSGTRQWDSKPIHMGSDSIYLVLYGTGLRNRSALDRTYVFFIPSNRTVALAYAGPQPEYAGLDQVNTLIPVALKGVGPVLVTVSIDGQYSNAVTLLFRE